MIDKHIIGVALVPTVTQAAPAFQVRQLQQNNIPVVFCHRGVPDVAAPLITWDFQEVGRLAARALLERGHRHIGYFAVYRYPITEEHEQGLRVELGRHGLSLPAERVFYGQANEPFSEEALKLAALRRLLQGPEPVTGIFCNDDDEAELIYLLAQEMGVRVPEDLSIIGFGKNERNDGYIRKRLAAVTVSEFTLGGRAVKILEEMITGNRPLDSQEVICKPLILAEGQTLGAAPTSRAAAL